ncbi:MAG: hypothetical protein M1536_07615 [Firmicutes bacterium]|nr:hypothetical protein [Bacillota bacterium]
MKKLFLLAAVILILALSYAAQPAAASPGGGKPTLIADKTIDFIAMYKQFFKNLIDKHYEKAWNSMTKKSQHTIAKLIAKKSKGNATEQQVLNMLNTDENKIRTTYFDGFTKTANLKNIYENGIFKMKSNDGKKVCIIIELNKEPNVFKILKENGEFKINFFEDLFQ